MAHWARCRGHACLRNLPACTAWALGPERSEVTAVHTQWTSASLGHSSRGGLADQSLGTWRAGLLEQMLPLTAQFGNGFHGPKGSLWWEKWRPRNSLTLKKHGVLVTRRASTAVVTLRGLPSDWSQALPHPLQASSSTAWLLTGRADPLLGLLWASGRSKGATFCDRPPKWRHFLPHTQYC